MVQGITEATWKYVKKCEVHSQQNRQSRNKHQKTIQKCSHQYYLQPPKEESIQMSIKDKYPCSAKHCVITSIIFTHTLSPDYIFNLFVTVILSMLECKSS
jgi:hypothetical protein